MTTTVEPGVTATLAAAAAVLIVGRALVGRTPVLARYSIPAAVAGGLLAAAGVAALHVAGVRVRFDGSMTPALMLAFFASVGLGADLRLLARGGVRLVAFTAAIAAMLIVQNLIGVSIASLLGLDPLVGLLAGSITLSGGHGTGAAWGQKLQDDYGVAGAPEIALAVATFGLVAGGLVGGPVARRLVDRLAARGEPLGTADGHVPVAAPAPAGGSPTVDRLIVTLLLITGAMTIGTELARWSAHPSFALPAFVWTLFAGVLLRNALAAVRMHEVDDRALTFVGEIALALFLALALMSLRLWEVATLAAPLLAIVVVQIAAVAAIATLLTFRILGADYEAAVMVAGQCGFGLGATPTAIANMQAVTARFGHAPQAFIVVPVVGAFLIDLMNALTLGAFVAWLGAGR